MRDSMRMLAMVMPLTFALSCVPWHIYAPESATELAGDYYRGDGLGYNIYLHLDQTGAYSATWRGCLGEYGAAQGRWSLEDDRIIFARENETGMMKGHLRQLYVRRIWQRQFLVSDPGDSDFRRFPTRLTAFRRGPTPRSP